jgi:hypothetical protein
MNITIFSICWNEEFLLPDYFKWYKSRFSKANFIVFDNESTDNSVRICKNNGAIVVPYKTDGQLSDSKYLHIKNNCWKGFDGWVLVGDIDEWLDINEEDLNFENNTSLIKSCGWNMCDKYREKNYQNLKYGIRSVQYDKFLCFNTSKIKEINYTPGAHLIAPLGDIVISNKIYNMLHMKFLDEDYMVNRYKQFKNRMSIENKNKGWGIQYRAEEEQIRVDFKNHLNTSKNIYE